MPQKQLVKGKKIEKKQAANKHGKGSVRRKGKLEKPPKKGKALELYKDNKEISKAINAANESTMASKAEGAGGKLKTIQAPALTPKDQQEKKNKEPKGKATADSDMEDD